MSAAPGVGAHGEGETAEAAAAVAGMRVALSGLIAEFSVPDQLTVTVEVA